MLCRMPLAMDGMCYIPSLVFCFSITKIKFVACNRHMSPRFRRLTVTSSGYRHVAADDRYRATCEAIKSRRLAFPTLMLARKWMPTKKWRRLQVCWRCPILWRSTQTVPTRYADACRLPYILHEATLLFNSGLFCRVGASNIQWDMRWMF